MSNVNPEILKACDIRGVYPRPLGNSQAKIIGLAVGTLIKDESHRNIKVVVGHDIRHSSEKLSQSLIQGLHKTGLKIVDAGLVSTPLLAFATRFSGASIGVMVTASHNPPQYNGFKFFTQGFPASIFWINKFYELIKKGNFRKGAGVLEKKDFFPDYRNALVNELAINFNGFRLVLDTGNGMAALTAPLVLTALHCDLRIMNGTPNGVFPGRGADSSSPQALAAIGTKVKRSKAHLGVAFDGDADRVSFVDEKGVVVPNDLILCLFAKSFLKGNKVDGVVFDVKCSDIVEKTVLEAGGKPLLERSGHSFIFNRILHEKALMGGEASGHFFLPGAFPGDALFACLKLMEIMKESNQSLSQLSQPYPARVSSHDIKVEFPSEKLHHLYDSLKSRAIQMGGTVSNVDGVRAVFSDGWGIIRMSVTESVLSFRFEGPSAKQLTSLAEMWLQDLPELQAEVISGLTANLSSVTAPKGKK